MTRSPDERHTWKLNWNVSMITQSEESKCMWTHSKDGATWQFQKSATRIGANRKGRSGENGGKIEWKSSEVDTSVVSRGQNKLIVEFKMAVGALAYHSHNSGINHRWFPFIQVCRRDWNLCKQIQKRTATSQPRVSHPM